MRDWKETGFSPGILTKNQILLNFLLYGFLLSAFLAAVCMVCFGLYRRMLSWGVRKWESL